MTDPFSKRVALLEKWHKHLLPNLKDMDDLADIILDIWTVAEEDTTERIIKLLSENADNTNWIEYHMDDLETLIRMELDGKL